MVTYTLGRSLAKILKGASYAVDDAIFAQILADQYDIIGFDPRGVNLTRVRSTIVSWSGYLMDFVALCLLLRLATGIRGLCCSHQ
jgi:pimeloyl-ACP methyl ester carboxylesterase